MLAIRNMQIAQDMPDPKISSMPKLEGVIRGIRTYQLKHANKQPKIRLPITPEILLKLRAIWEYDRSNSDHIMIWAACCVAFFGFFRSGEITAPLDAGYDPAVHMNLADVSINSLSNPSILKLRLKASKTDPLRKGVDIVLGRAKGPLCPIAALMSYLAIRGQDPGFCSGLWMVAYCQKLSSWIQSRRL